MKLYIMIDQLGAYTLDNDPGRPVEMAILGGGPSIYLGLWHWRGQVHRFQLPCCTVKMCLIPSALYIYF